VELEPRAVLVLCKLALIQELLLAPTVAVAAVELAPTDKALVALALLET
jgi:hypothetical protein